MKQDDLQAKWKELQKAEGGVKKQKLKLKF